MFIDFHPFNIPPKVYQKSVYPQAFGSYQPIQDTFTKSIRFKSDNYSGDFDNIKITKRDFGTIEKSKEKATLYTITNKNGASVDLSTYGATITSIKVPDRNGKIVDVTQGYDNVTPYEKFPIGHAGSTIGPYANKIDNGAFVLNGKEYKLECNKDNGTTHSHGGTQGFDTKNWKAKPLKDGVEFSYEKVDMENGYPANVTVKVTYKFDNDNNLHIIYSAKSDNDTILNMTNHTYFNLDGAVNSQENSVYEHIVTLPNSKYYTKNNEKAVPTGKLISVKDTPFDFTQSKKISADIDKEDEQLKIGSGYDQNYVIDGYDGKSLIKIANVKSPKTGIVLDVATNLPGFQFYSANHLGKSAQPAGKDGTRYEKRSAFCIEPQFYPNAINNPNFTEKGILRKGEEYNREIVYSFSTEQ